MADSTVLTKEHIQFIRAADKVVFRHVHGATTLEVTNKLGAQLDVQCAFAFRGYGRAEKWDGSPAKAFAMIHAAQFDQAWLTVAHILRPGDVLTLSFCADSNGYTRAAGYAGSPEMEAFDSLHHDSMELIIERFNGPTGSKRTRLTFNLCDSICPDNTARMIQRY